ncbi:MAG TPA: hypothetical protein VM055_07875 [Novosphingobium sp.]|nr:hypothetical protein [Novosphingobium sp.]
MRSAFAPPLGDGSCVTAIPNPRGDNARATAATSDAAGRVTGEATDGKRIFMDCINLEVIRNELPDAAPWPAADLLADPVRDRCVADRGRPAPLAHR